MLTQFQTDNKDFQLMQNSWGADINPIIQNPLVNGIFLKGTRLIANQDNLVAHKLSRNFQGWIVTRLIPDTIATASTYYEEGTFTANFNAGAGAGASANTSKTIKFTRAGNMVVLQYPDCNNMTAGATNAAFQSVGAVPSRLRPGTELDWVSTQMSSAGAVSTVPGNLSIRTNGDMYIFRNANASTVFGIGDVNNGSSATTVTYTTTGSGFNPVTNTVWEVALPSASPADKFINLHVPNNMSVDLYVF